MTDCIHVYNLRYFRLFESWGKSVKVLYICLNCSIRIVDERLSTPEIFAFLAGRCDCCPVQYELIPSWILLKYAPEQNVGIDAECNTLDLWVSC